MSTMRSFVLASVAAAGLVGVGPAIAHHSTAAFDTGQVVKIEGTITQFRWINPHASIKIDGGTGKGLWTIEMTAPNVLINDGWTRDALQIGDKVTIYANPLRNAVTLNDGSRVFDPERESLSRKLSELLELRLHYERDRGVVLRFAARDQLHAVESCAEALKRRGLLNMP